MREIWLLQPRFRERQGKRPLRLLTHPRFRAAYDFLCLRSAAGEELQDVCQWWTDVQQAATDVRMKMAGVARKRSRPRCRRRGASAHAKVDA